MAVIIIRRIVMLSFGLIGSQIAIPKMGRFQIDLRYLPVGPVGRLLNRAFLRDFRPKDVE